MPTSFKSHSFFTRLQIPEDIRTMPELDMARILKEDVNDESKGLPPRFGFPHKVNFNLDNAGVWQKLSGGDKLWQLKIRCPNALSINLLYDKFQLPEGGKFFVYTSDRKHTLGAFTASNNKGTKKKIEGFATGLLYGDEITLEYYHPKQAKEKATISIAYVVHGYRYIKLPVAKNTILGASGNCQVNVNCPEGSAWQQEKNAVALILVNGIRWCTGSLINTTANDNRPLFLTADHCLNQGDAINNPNLNHYSFYWHYEAPSCENISNEPPILSTVGATVLANNSISDFALLRLTEDPRNKVGVSPYYLGWDRSGNPGTGGGVGIHHPRGDVKKISTYSMTPINSLCRNSNYWDVSWISTVSGYSVMQPGSSGSPLINQNKRIIGQLYGPGSCSPNQCENPNAQKVAYGKFSVSWTGNNASDRRRRLKDWLDPYGIGATTWNGVGVVSDSEPVWNGRIRGIWTSPRNGEPLQAEVIPPHPDAQQYVWSIDGNVIERTSSNQLSTYNWPCKPKKESFSVVVITSNGTTAPIDCEYFPLCTRGYYSLYPNPARGAVTLEWKDEPQAAPSAAGVMAVDKAPEAYEVQLWSGTRMLRSYRTTDKKFQFDIAPLPRGIYIVRIIKGKQTYSEKLIKE